MRASLAPTSTFVRGSLAGVGVGDRDDVKPVDSVEVTRISGSGSQSVGRGLRGPRRWGTATHTISAPSDEPEDEEVNMSGRVSRRGLLGVVGGVAASLPFARRAAAATSASGLVTLRTPLRVFDSRRNEFPTNGAKLQSGQGIGVPVSMAYIGGDVAESVFVNCTITQTEGSGFLIIFPSDLTGERPDPDTSNINWSTSGQTLANLTLTAVGGENTIAVHCEGGGRTQ
jgi:hypothetical protein